MLLKADGHCTGVGAGVDLEVVGDAVAAQDLIQFRGAGAQTVLIADVDGDGSILF